MPAVTATAQPATPVRSRVLALCLGFLIIMLAAQPAFSATIQTDLWVYQQGDTVTVTGADYDPGETVEIITTDPNGAEVDRGTAFADELGGFTYQFVLNSGVPGIYDVVGIGLTSGLVAATQFDPQTVTIANRNPNNAARPWFRAVAGGFDATISGSTSCTGGSGSGCSALNAVAVTLFGTDGANSAVAAGNQLGLPGTNGTKAATLTGGNWTVTFEFRTSPSGTQLGIPADGRFDVRAVGTFTLNNSSTATAQDISDEHFGVDNTQPSSAITSGTPAPPYGPGGNLNVTGTAADATSGLATPAVAVTLRSGTPTGTILFSATNNASGGTWSVTFGSPPTAAGTYCVVSVATDIAGNVQDPGASQCWTIAGADGAAPVVTLTLPTPPAGQGGYFNGTGSQVPVTGSVSATDPSGVDAIDCNDSASGLTLGPLTAGARSVSISGNGTHDISCTATDGAGNTGAAAGSSNAATVLIDVDAPTVSATPSRVPDSNGWYNSPFSVQFSGVDVGPSGGVTCDADVNYSGPDTSSGSITRSCTDAAGNSASTTFHFMYDGSGPGAAATPDRATDHHGWYNAPVTVSFTPVGADLSDSVVCDSPVIYSGPDDEDISVSGDCTDAAGNSTTATFTFDFDDTDPTVTVTPDRDPDHNGWYNAPVDFTTEGDDETSGIDTCTDVQTYTTPDGEGLTVSGSCTDEAGNSASADSDAFDFDNTDPTITLESRLPAPNGNGWNNSAVTVSWTCTDATSLPVLATVSTLKEDEGDGQYASNHCEDNAGNSSATDTVSDIRIDLTDPTITFDGQTPDANVNGWNNTAVTLEWTCADDLSGPVAPDDSEILSTEGADQQATGTCTDLADNTVSDTQVDIDIDLTDPTITFVGQTPAANFFGWNNTAVTLKWTCTDDLSGPAAPDDSEILSTEGANQQATGTCTDLADNSDSDTQTDIDIDLTDPNVAITSPADGLSTIALTVAVSGTQSDGLSGIDSVNVNGLPATLGATTFAVGAVPLSCGSNEITATAVDQAGNSEIDVIHVTRICFTGMQYYAPLDQSTSSMAHPVTNSGKIGRVIPTKVTFKLDDGTAVTDALAAARGWNIQIGVNGADCDNGGTTDSLEAYADAGQSSAGTNLFRWASGQWTYNLDTNKPPVPASMVANKCYRLDVYVHDGTNKVKVSTDTYAIFKPMK